jgi:DNA polymerase
MATSMRWTERQRAMLREMGIRLWLPEDEPAAAASVVAATVATATTAEEATPVRPSPAAASSSSLIASAAQPPWATADELRDEPLAPADWLVYGEGGADFADPEQLQLLRNMLRAIGADFDKPSREGRVIYVGPGAPAAEGERGTTLQEVAPRCVLALGLAAAKRLLGTDAPLGSLRGRVHTYRGIPLVVTFSLAYLLRHPAEKAKAWADLCLAVGALSA